MGRKSYRDGRIHVMADKCSTCVFRPGNLMRLAPGRLADLIETNLAADTAFACHQTIYQEAVDEVICHGYHDSYGDCVTALRMARAMGLIQWVTP